MFDEKVIKAMSLFVTNPSAIYARLSWPLFSVASYSMISALKRQGYVPNTIIDVGANVGQFAVASAKLFNNSFVLSFEPQPDCVEILKRNVRNLSNVKVFPVALGDSAGEVALHVNSHRHSSSILALARSHREAFPDARETATIQVPISTLDEALRDAILTPPVLLKLDVQGYEPNVLRGATQTLRRTDHILVEMSFRPMYEGEMIFRDFDTVMRQIGFRFLRPLEWLSDPGTGEILQMDALYERDY